MISIYDFLTATIFSIILSFILSYFFIKKNFLLDQISTSGHKKLTIDNLSNKIALCGGIIIFISSIVFFKNELYLVKIFSFSVLIVGILSDINKLNSPKIRIILQFFIVTFFLLFYENLAISDLRIIFINNILEIKLISTIFTIFCILILMNGSNFLDGLNTLVIGYYILVLGTTILTSLQFNLYFDPNIFYLIIFLTVAFLFNFFNRIYLGDAGSYLISFLSAYFILDFYAKNDSVSPYFVCLLLWYPAFENLFSILRRTFFKKKVERADQDHLHQLIYRFFKNKNYLDKKYTNTSVGVLINIFNFSIFIMTYRYYNFTTNIVLIIFFNISIYLLLYFFLKKKLSHYKKYLKIHK
jgi:UDP-N-acetylmuramyl pentapeptide phosphotransferase/UDP-N-acetylglucosamine-1-phosphate transferase